MLPGPYERWFTEVCGRPGPVETRSTCDHCVMEPGSPGLPPEGAFDPALRCCTYHPHLAPHFVGAILESGSAAGQAVVRQRIAARVGVTPLGLGPTPAYDATYQRVIASPGAFGHSAEIVCPFLAESRCTIWSQRGVACAAFHCKFDRGVYGAGLWNLISTAFTVVERALARWLLDRQGIDSQLCDELLRAPEDSALDARAWGAWHGREDAYFTAASRLVAPLTWAEVEAIGGRELKGLGAALSGALARFDAMTPPAQVRRGDQILYRLGGPGQKRLQHPSVPHDAVELPDALADRIATLVSSTPLADLGLDAELTRRLFDWQILVPAQ